jgi:hypothetical protein
MGVMTATSNHPITGGFHAGTGRGPGGILRARNSHNAADFAACFAPRGELHVIPNGDVAQGREQIEALLEPQFRAFPDWHIERRGLYACGEAAWGRMDGHRNPCRRVHGYAATHRGIELRGCSSFRFTSDGLIAVEDLYFDPQSSPWEVIPGGWVPWPTAVPPASSACTRSARSLCHSSHAWTSRAWARAPLLDGSASKRRGTALEEVAEHVIRGCAPYSRTGGSPAAPHPSRHRTSRVRDSTA